jgi:histone deacetylase 11
MKKNKLPIVYSDDYNIRFFGLQKLHPFDTEKYQKIVRHLKKTLAITNKQLYKQNNEISVKELLKVHSKAYLQSLENKQNIAQVAELHLLAKIPLFLLKSKLLKPIKKAVAGTLFAGELALKHGWSINLSGGYHHAKRDRGEGFCFFADINLLIEHLREKKLIESAMIVDLDAHQGNGHESIHGSDFLVSIFDMYNSYIYPRETNLKPYIDFDIPLQPYTSDKVYLDLLKKNINQALNNKKPDIIIYVAGSDIYEKDILGGLKISKEGIKKRDRIMFQNAQKYNIPIVMLLAGGYHKDGGKIMGESIEEILREKLFESKI